jgi:hypothetical protein
MMTKAPITSFASILVACASLAAAAGTALAAGLNIDPSSITDTYTGQITFTISGVPSGSTVLVEAYADLNNSRAVDAGDMLVQSFQVTDGQALSIGGVRDTNVPGDDDGAPSPNGQIRAVLNFGPVAGTWISGNFLYRVSPTAGGFTAVTAPFTVTQDTSLPQGVTGQVTSNGTPVSAAFVVLPYFQASGLAAAALADSTGHFTLNAAPGTYPLFALKSGFVFDATAPPQVTINTGATVTQNVSLTAANRNISGQVTDAANPTTGISGLPLSAEWGDQGPGTLVFTDTNGNFTMPVSTALSQWRLGSGVARESCAMLGYLAPPDQNVDISSGNVSGLSIHLTKVDALIYGSLKDNLNNPLPNIEIEAQGNTNQDNNPKNVGRTDTSGNYVVGVTGGDWSVGPNSDDPGLVGYFISSQDVTVATGQALQVNFVAQAACAHLRGHVMDESSTPVGNVSVLACLQNQGGNCPSSTTLADGSFDIAVTEGTWNVFLESDSAAQEGLIGSQLSVTVTCPNDQNGLTLSVLYSCAQITGVVEDGGGNATPNLYVCANTSVNGTNYNSCTSTDTAGNYSLPAASGTWQVNLDCGDLQSRGYLCPDQQSVTMSCQDQTVNFTVQTLSPCVGDCDGGGTVTVNEIIAMVNIALGSAGASVCPHGIPNGAQVNVALIIQAVLNALSECPAG